MISISKFFMVFNISFLIFNCTKLCGVITNKRKTECMCLYEQIHTNICINLFNI